MFVIGAYLNEFDEMMVGMLTYFGHCALVCWRGLCELSTHENWCYLARYRGFNEILAGSYYFVWGYRLLSDTKMICNVSQSN